MIICVVWQSGTNLKDGGSRFLNVDTHDLNIHSCENLKFWLVLLKDVLKILGQPASFGLCMPVHTIVLE
jgi:hypothetical protein